MRVKHAGPYVTEARCSLEAKEGFGGGAMIVGAWRLSGRCVSVLVERPYYCDQHGWLEP